jgi:hypothetical protein
MQGTERPNLKECSVPIAEDGSPPLKGNARPSLKECLVSIAEDESPPLNGTLEVDYIVLRRVNLRKSHVYVEFVDGDVRDGKEWFEGPVPTDMTIGALFGMREERTRGERREMYGRDKLKGGKMRKTRRDARKRTLRARDEKIAETCDDEHQSKEGGVDFPKPKFQKTE